ncbi:hypothetical protein POPTR_017G048100v4 [Populus trichocarpa]|uniref:Uncharacterized protein n=1 Tax=Populus trichocarpa TaxID=3694 RepID=A0ACC0RQB1_POPTR|nr:hypothetical protein POPTR_017G048100v4 [Populus trichocarpa]
MSSSQCLERIHQTWPQEARSKVAAAGFFVVVTDFLYGDPVDLSKPDFDSHGHEDAKLVIAALRSKGMNSIGAAGSCWGEVKIPVAFLGAEIDRASTPEQLKEYLQNLSILDSSLFDLSMSRRDEKAEEDTPASLAFDSHVKILPGVSHGWTVRYNVEDDFHK